MEAFTTSAGLVALAEIGDKTQLLTILLSARFKRPWPVVGGIFAATLANHALAAFLGAEASVWLQGAWFCYLVAASFIGMGFWTLVPDTLDEADRRPPRFGPFLATLIAFFVVEMGDKTQLATIALGARFHDVAAVAAGTTLGMMIANVPAVLAGDALIRRVPLTLVRALAALLFIGLGLWLLVRAGGLA